jgi:hypothetical protein
MVVGSNDTYFIDVSEISTPTHGIIRYVGGGSIRERAFNISRVSSIPN